MTVPNASSSKIKIPPGIRDLLSTIANARPNTVSARRIVEAIRSLQEMGYDNWAERLIAHLITEKNGYVTIVYGSARKWGKSGHDGFDAEDLARDTLILIAQGLRNRQEYALYWPSFCYKRFLDAKRVYNGRTGKKAKIEKALKALAVPDGELDDPDEEDLIPDQQPSAQQTPSMLEKEEVRDERRIDRDLLDFFSTVRNRFDHRDEIEDADLEAWGRRVLNKLIEGISDSEDRLAAEVRLVAQEMFSEDPPCLTGGPDEAGRLSLAEQQGWPAYKAKYRLKKAKAYMAERLIKDYIEGPGLREQDAIERAWLRAWYNKHVAKPSRRGDPRKTNSDS